ncbi:sensor histidine kinase [Mangrovibacterium marinum]|uniref:Histidine kinase n=1 Tax=Mangrovibacterium marinum TaxID=1639118 RepID=A0A2T5C3M6_9BACT|nr:sensor histidine kinase [Mangrovibacterium marinum]PTN09353.1 histidine kinase [Mangrovibacterium marinum]
MAKIKQYSLGQSLLYVVLWCIIAIVLHYVSIDLSGVMNNIQYSKLLVLLVGSFYLNYFVLIPRLLSKRKVRSYAASLVGTLAVVFGLIYFSELPFYEHHPVVFDTKTEALGYLFIPLPSPMTLSTGIVLLCIVSLAVSTGIRGTSEWFKQENQLKEIENKKLVAELSYLKAQINPHFFFNTLNSIYALARQKSDKTPDVILLLSGLMRYVIYEASAPRVYLKKEVEHIRNFIELQQMRLSQIVRIDYQVNGNPKGILIEPLIFTVLVENAFKHGIDYTRKNTIRVHLDIKANELHFLVSNPLVMRRQTKISKFEDAGIGLDNVKKRLDLLYPGRHSLAVIERDSIYTVELKLTLERANHEMHNH